VEIGRIVVVDNKNNMDRHDDIAADHDDHDADVDDDDDHNDEETPKTRSFNFPESRQRLSVVAGYNTSGDSHRYARGVSSGYALPGAGGGGGSLIFPSAPGAMIGGREQTSSDTSHRISSGEMSTGSVSAILNSEINKSSSLIFPIGVSSNGHHDGNLEAWKSNAINQRVNQCEKRKLFKQKKELMLDDLKLTADDIPLQLLNETTLGNTLYKLTLKGNRLKAVPDKLVQCLPALRILDLQQCDLRTLPKHWNLPRLVTLDLSHNLLVSFPEDVRIPLTTQCMPCAYLTQGVFHDFLGCSERRPRVADTQFAL
jgi:Leucine-rich repeat (LRR) protein